MITEVQLLPETEQKLYDLIEAIAVAERKLENCRRVLAETPAFEPYAAYLRINQQRTDFISTDDIINFLGYLRIES